MAVNQKWQIFIVALMETLGIRFQDWARGCLGGGMSDYGNEVETLNITSNSGMGRDGRNRQSDPRRALN